MKERPIIFSGPMVRAVLDDRKTQTRRIVKFNAAGRVQAAGGYYNWHPDDPDAVAACPYGRAGDHLWVRETWYCDHFQLQRGPYLEVPQAKELLYYRARDAVRPDERECWSGFAGETMTPPWKSPIHMPRWASRITLKITGIRIERLNDISDSDCIAEGIFNGEYDPGIADGGKPGWCYGPNLYAGTPRHAYELLWESIHGKGSWELNPRVWVVTFERVDGASVREAA